MITANFPEGYKEITVPGLYQWDENQVLRVYGISGLAPVVQAHFCDKSCWEAIVYNAIKSEDGTYYDINIPNSLLENTHDINCFIYGIASGTTPCKHSERVIHLPVAPRKKPEDFISTPDTATVGKIDEIYSKMTGLQESTLSQIEANTATGTANSLSIASLNDALTSVITGKTPVPKATEAANVPGVDKYEDVEIVTKTNQTAGSILANNITDKDVLEITFAADVYSLDGYYVQTVDMTPGYATLFGVCSVDSGTTASDDKVRLLVFRLKIDGDNSLIIESKNYTNAGYIAKIRRRIRS